MKHARTLSLVCALVFFAPAAVAEEPPEFYKKTYPEHALQAMQEANEALMGEKAQLAAKTRELIALGVAAQIPCAYCIYYHNRKARSLGASEAEIREAVATAAHVRHWSTVLNGMAYDLGAFKAEVDNMLATN